MAAAEECRATVSSVKSFLQSLRTHARTHTQTHTHTQAGTTPDYRPVDISRLPHACRRRQRQLPLPAGTGHPISICMY